MKGRHWILSTACLIFVQASVTAADLVVNEAVRQAERERISAIAKASRSAVSVFAAGKAGGGGSGVVISPDGYALTNFHVSKPCGEHMKCSMNDGQLYDAVIVGIDPTGDVALIKLLGRDDFPAAEMGDSDELEVGQWCFAVGNPFLLATNFEPTVTYGIVSGVHRYQYPAGTLLEYADCIQTDAAINPGNSGGPLFNSKGQLVGINGRGSFEKRGRVNVGVGYAISINQIKHFLGHLKSGRIVDHATLGASVGSDEDGSVVVTNILDSSDAYRRGLRYGDQVISFAGRPIDTVNGFKNVLGIFPKGWRVPISYRRDGEHKENRKDALNPAPGSDFFVLMEAWRQAVDCRFRVDDCQRIGVHAQAARQVGPLFQQFLRVAEREGLDTQAREVPVDTLRKLILAGFSDRIARRLDGGTLRCELTRGRRADLARESVVDRAPLLVASDIRELSGRDAKVTTLLSLATAIEPDWLREFFPQDFKCERRAVYDSTSKRVYADEVELFRDLVLSSKRSEAPPPEQAASLLADEVVAGRLALKHWNHATEQWILRVNFLSEVCPEFELPAIGAEDRRYLIEQICHGAASYKEIKDRPVAPTVKSWLNETQRDLVEKHAPERAPLSNGRRPKLIYREGQAPKISLRLQDLYDVAETPRIALNRAPVLLEILAPNMRPVQLTEDLAGFWREQYPKVKSELQRRYPKHEWR